MVDDFVFVQVRHRFWNDEPKKLSKAAYIFPLPHSSAIPNFGCYFGQRSQFKRLEAVAQPRVKARNFERAVKDERPSGLLEQNTTEVFTATLGSIPAHARMRTEIIYFGNLKSL